MKILVIGGTGRVSPRRRAARARSTYESRAPAPSARHAGGKVEVATGDLTDPPAIEAAFKAVEKTSLVNAVKLTLRMTPRGRNYDLDDERQPYF